MNERFAQSIAELECFMGTVDDALAIPRVAGEFAHALVLASGARRGLEIGTSYGYSGLWIASALAENGGRLITVDRDSRKSAAARRNFDGAGLGKHVEVRTGPAEDVLPQLEGPFDFVLNDADKENCLRYVELVADKLAERAIVLTDNTSTHATELAEFMTRMRQRPDFHTVTLEVGNGMELSVKRAAPRLCGS